MRLRNLLLATVATLISTTAVHANDADTAVKWQWRVEPSAVKPGEDAEIIFSAAIPEGFILYSSDFSAELGPRPAKFSYEARDDIEIKGPIAAVESKRKKDKVFGSEYSYFANRAEFRQKVRVLKSDTTLTGRIDGQTCQEKDGVCLLFKEPFSIRLN
ncbi:protein-disulfide reductase DsbD domain-containing protein [Steroidobacter sp.]|uniref:protein-disulfide reductase DsbD domain-containing protein n=1 Tax=Steroidobacter sp. TaxID=1978227 RepID=UPI001A58A1E7|nr:protein-disulfide reductase DsbD domain-containing protein [Steroidobacter sp.]MBL8266110.1 hypothetical protein [Steroidobacter sp.]